MSLIKKPVPLPRTKKNVLTREEIMSNLKLVPLPRTKFCRKPRNFEKNKTFKEKTYTFTKMYCLLQNKIKEYTSSPENLVKNLKLSQYKCTPDALLTHKCIYPYG